MNVADLIKILKTYPQDMVVVVPEYSERCILERSDIHLDEACPPRDDGWVQNKRPDVESVVYLVIGH